MYAYCLAREVPTFGIVSLLTFRFNRFSKTISAGSLRQLTGPYKQLGDPLEDGGSRQ